jgi:hypothetical protein
MVQKAAMKGYTKLLLGAVVVMLIGSTMIPLASGATIVIIPGGQSWAYGASREVNFTGTAVGPDGGTWDVSGMAYFGWAVIHQQFNTSSTTFEIFSQRAMAAHYYILYCRPNCATPTVTVNSTVFAWEQNNVWTNFTRDGSVYVSGSATPAVAIDNLSAISQSNVTVVHTASNSRLANYLQLAYGSAATYAQASLTFDPALGLFPTASVLNESWNATSDFTGSGSWSGSYHLYGPALGLRANSIQGTLQKTGNVTLTGQDVGSIVLTNGKVGRVIEIQLNGPFRLVDGWFPVLSGADLFSSALQPWMTMGHMGLAENTGAIDVSSDSGGASVVAATNVYTPNTDTPSTGTAIDGAMDLVPSDSGVSQATIQAQPMSVSNAQSMMSSLLTPFVGPTSPSTTPVRGAIVLIVVAVVVVAVVAAFSVTRKRAPPTRSRPAEPNAAYHDISKEPVVEGPSRAGEQKDKEDTLGYLM